MDIAFQSVGPQLLNTSTPRLTRSTLPELNRIVADDPGATTITLPDRFTRVVESVAADLLQGYHVHVAGSAGTGKSVLIRLATEIVSRRSGRGVALTAPTGIAARNIDGVTCHSFFGLRTVSDYTEYKVNRIPKRLRDYLSVNKPSALVIDEISMMRVDVFDQVAHLLELINGATAGPGLRLPVLTVGDMLQLPPVVERDVCTRLRTVYGSNTDFFAVRSPYWDEMLALLRAHRAAPSIDRPGLFRVPERDPHGRRGGRRGARRSRAFGRRLGPA